MPRTIWIAQSKSQPIISTVNVVWT